MYNTNYHTLLIRDDLEIPTAWPCQKLKLNREWATTLAKKSWESYTSGEHKEVWSIQPDKRTGLAGYPVNELLNQLFPTIGNRGKKGRVQALQCAVLTAAQTLHTSAPPTQIHGFLQSTTTKQPKQIERYKVSAFSNPMLGKVLHALADIGLLEFHKGFKGIGHPKGLTSLWIPTEDFHKWLLDAREHLSPIRFMDDTELLLLKDDNKTPKDYIDSPDTQATRERLASTNRLRAAHRWTYLPFEGEHQYREGINQVSIHPIDLECRRIFHGSFQIGGRFYCAAQNLYKEERKTVCIDGEPTVELDFKSMHPRMIYHKEGLDAPVDCYESDLMIRDVAKLVFLICVNAKDRTSALRAVMQDFSIPKELAQKYLDSLISQHSQINNWLFSSAWGYLHNLESQITDRALERAAQNNIPVIPIHDSYITRTRDVFKMRDLLLEVYRELLGADPVLDWKE